MLIFLIILVCALAAWYIAAPLWGSPALLLPSEASRLAGRTNSLRAQRDSLLRQLKELEFDLSMGKVGAEDHAALRATLAAETSTVLSALEQLEQPPRAGSTSITGAATSPAAAPASSAAAAIGVELEVLVERERHRRRQVGSWQCSDCGRRMSDGDLFCASCGTRRHAAFPSS